MKKLHSEVEWAKRCFHPVVQLFQEDQKCVIGNVEHAKVEESGSLVL